MSNRIKVKETPGETSLPQLYFRIEGVAAKTTLNAALIPDLTTSGLELKTMNTSMHDAIILGMGHDSDQVKLSHVIAARIYASFRQNSRDIEKAANISGDVTLPGKFGHEVIGPKTPIFIPEIYIELTPNKGEVAYRVKAIDLVYNYNMECTQLDEDRSVVILTDVPFQNAKGLLNGFISGAIYLFRSQPVFANGVKGEFTSYFEIRMG